MAAQVGENAYKIELTRDYGVHATFNVGDLSPYLDDVGLTELGSIPFQEEGIDAKSKESANVESAMLDAKMNAMLDTNIR